MAKAKQTKLTSSWDLAGQSVRLVRSHFTPFMYLVLLPGLLYSLGGIVMGTLITPEGKLTLDNLNPTGLGLIGIAAVWMLINLGPVTHFELSATKHGPKLIGDYYRSGLKDSIRIMVVTLLTGLAVLIGLIALIIPGLIALRMFILAPYYLVDKNLGIIEAMRVSAKNTKPFSGAIWGVIGVQIAVSFAAAAVGGIPVIGLIASFAISYSIAFLLALRYRTIEN